MRFCWRNSSLFSIFVSLDEMSECRVFNNSECLVPVWGGVAHLVEHWIPDPKAVSSSLATLIIRNYYLGYIVFDGFISVTGVRLSTGQENATVFWSKYQFNSRANCMQELSSLQRPSCFRKEKFCCCRPLPYLENQWILAYRSDRNNRFRPRARHT